MLKIKLPKTILKLSCSMSIHNQHTGMYSQHSSCSKKHVTWLQKFLMSDMSEKG